MAIEGGRQSRVAWLDVTAGVSGDMLLGALVDVGIDLAVLQGAVDAVLPGVVRLTSSRVRRASVTATKVDVTVRAADQPHRRWAHIRRLVEDSALPVSVRRTALETFGRLAEVEAHVHGFSVDDVQFHEVGAWDSIADVVGVCAGFDALGIESLVSSPIGVGSGHVRTAHGTLTVPVPAVVGLLEGWSVDAGEGAAFPGGTLAQSPSVPVDRGELATPTGVALLRALSTAQGHLPAMSVVAVGVGAGTRDPHDHPNVVRLLLGAVATSVPTASSGGSRTDTGLEYHDLVILETNVDDLDPRIWPFLLERLLAAGAADAWLIPIVMKKGRPAHTLSVLAEPSRSEALRDLILDETSTLGVRERPVGRWALGRAWIDVVVDGVPIAVKVGHRGGVVVHAMPELDEAAGAALSLGRSVGDVLDAASAAAVAAGLVRGAVLPRIARTTASR